MELQHDLDHPIVVAFAGYIGAGKDTAAGFLKEFVANFIYDQGSPDSRLELRPTSFAKPVKELLKFVYNLEDNDVYGHQDRAARERPHPHMAGMSPRRAMQLIATEGFRHLVDDDTWVAHWFRNQYEDARQCMAEAKAKLGGVHPIVLQVTDFRFLNEYEYMAANCPNLVLYFIDRHPKPRWQKFIDRWDVLNLTRHRSHDSERQIDDIRRRFPNACSVIDNRPQPWHGEVPSERSRLGLERFQWACHEAFMEDFTWRFVE